MGGTVAVPETEPVHREDTASVGGADRWATITQVGRVASGQPADRDSGSPAAPFPAVSAGRDQLCGLRTDDAVTCWGENGRNAERLGLTNGTIECWGNNEDRQSSPLSS